MMTEHAFEAWAARLGLTADARAFIQEIRRSGPSRLVHGTLGNVTVRYPSRKMGCTIQGESVRGEWAAVLDLEYDPDVLEYYDQPCVLWPACPTKAGAPGRPVRHVPDLFVLRTASAGFEECKPDAILRERAATSPGRYGQDADGTWRAPPVERVVAPYGFYYRIRNADAINWVANRNLVFLEEYLRAESLTSAEYPAAIIQAFVAANPALSLAELLRFAASHDIPADAVYTLIVLDRLYVDLRTYPLAEPERVPVFPSAALASIPAATSAPASGVDKVSGMIVTWDGRPYHLLNVGSTRITLQAEDDHCVELPHATFDDLVRSGSIVGVRAPAARTPSGEVWQRLQHASPEEQAEAVRRYQIIAPYLAGQRPARETTPERTIRLWLRAWRVAQQGSGCGLAGLLPRSKERGCRAPRLPEATRQVIDACIEQHYETLKQRSVRSVYGTLLQECERHTQQDPAFITPSYQTFRRRIKLRAGPGQTRRRAGARAAYQVASFYWELSGTTPRHGDRPWEIVHLDHTELDVQLVYEESGRSAGKCWLSIATDAYSRRFLAVYLSYDPPSYRSCMLLMRILVRLWGRLPQTVVVDHGPEFRSVYFETLLARYEVTKKSRPPAHPRHGSVCERLFGTTTTQLINNLRGNTQITKHVRQVTKGVDPARQACWTLATLYDTLCTFAYEVYDTSEHPALGCSPRDAYAAGLATAGARAHRAIAYDEAFRMQTLPSTPKGTAAIDPQRGVKIAGVYYWHEAFRDPRFAHQQAPVRYDPFDIGIAYAYVRNQWVQCHSEHYALLAGHSEREIQIVTRRLRERARSYGRSVTITAAQLAQFLSGVEAQETVLVQRLRDREGRRLGGRTDAGAVHRTDGARGAAVMSGRLEGDQPRHASDESGHDPAGDQQPRSSAAATAARERRRLKPYGSFL